MMQCSLRLNLKLCLRCFSYYDSQETQKPSRHIDSELICLLRVKPDHNITEESFTCQALDPVDVSSLSIFEDGEELISNIVHIAPTADSVYKVSHLSNSADLRFLFVSFLPGFWQNIFCYI